VCSIIFPSRRSPYSFNWADLSAGWTAIGDIGGVNTVLVTIKNGDGGFASFSLKRL